MIRDNGPVAPCAVADSRISSWILHLSLSILLQSITIILLSLDSVREIYPTLFDFLDGDARVPPPPRVGLDPRAGTALQLLSPLSCHNNQTIPRIYSRPLFFIRDETFTGGYCFRKFLRFRHKYTSLP
jgi:hypothetical protein